jgi:site-specific DNA recombinase
VACVAIADELTRNSSSSRPTPWGLTNRRGRPLTSQAIDMLLRNQLYAGIVDVPEYGVRGKRGDFEPLISEDLFYRVQSILSGRVMSTAPRQRAHPDFPLRGFVRCASCGRGFCGSWPLIRSAASQRRDRTLISHSARSEWRIARRGIQ